ncbi:unnamed protein product [Effrenium voratum]|nr:unnamed protein product [Effrenium voratum]
MRGLAWPTIARPSRLARRFCSPAEKSAAEKAKESQQLWNTFVPEQNWDFRSPLLPTLVLGIVVLQYLISQKKADVAEKELEEAKLLMEERRARRARRETEAE